VVLGELEPRMAAKQPIAGSCSLTVMMTSLKSIAAALRDVITTQTGPLQNVPSWMVPISRTIVVHRNWAEVCAQPWSRIGHVA
jgi:hypothetical protein